MARLNWTRAGQDQMPSRYPGAQRRKGLYFPTKTYRLKNTLLLRGIQLAPPHESSARTFPGSQTNVGKQAVRASRTRRDLAQKGCACDICLPRPAPPATLWVPPAWESWALGPGPGTGCISRVGACFSSHRRNQRKKQGTVASSC